MSEARIEQLAGDADRIWKSLLVAQQQLMTAYISAEVEIESLLGAHSGVYVPYRNDFDCESIFKSFARRIDDEVARSRSCLGVIKHIDYDPESPASYGNQPRFGAENRTLNEHHKEVIEYAMTRSLVEYARQQLRLHSSEDMKDGILSDAVEGVQAVMNPKRWPGVQLEPAKIQRVKDRLMVECSKHINESWSRGAYDSYSASTVRTFVESCSTLLMDVGCAAVTAPPILRRLDDDAFPSRTRLDCGEGLFLVLFKTKCQFHFREDVLNQLQMTVIERARRGTSGKT